MSPKLILLIIWRRFWIVVLAFLSTVASAGTILLFVPARYDAVATASMDPGQLDPVTGLPQAQAMYRIVQGNLVALVKSHRVAMDVVKRLNLERNPVLVDDYRASAGSGRVDFSNWMAAELLKNLTAGFAEGSNVLSITYKSSSPVQASVTANAFLSAAVDAGVAMKVSSAQQTAQWFEPQMEKMRAELVAARQKLAQFQQESKLLASMGANDSENSELLSIINELSGAKSLLLSLESQLHATSANAAAGASEVTDTPTLTTLKGNLASVTAEISKVRSELGLNNPRLAGLNATRTSLLEQIKSEIAANRDSITARIKSLRGQVEYLEQARADKTQKLISVQTQRDQLATLQRDVEFRQAQVDNSAKGAASARLQSQLSLSILSVLDYATPPVDRAFPKPIIVIPASIGFGLALGLIFSLLAEAFDRRIRVPADLTFATSAPLLGTLAKAPRRVRPKSRWARISPFRPKRSLRRA
jgi:polysaccharide biosynthesis transport protein